MPKVYLSNDLGARKNEYEMILQLHGAILVQSPAEATHIVVEDVPESIGNDRGSGFLRVNQIRAKFAHIHWWFYPDSYDAWIGTSDVHGPEVVPQSTLEGVHTVTARWVRDLDAFNEFMNEKDYQIGALQGPKQYFSNSAAPAVGGKRPADSTWSSTEAKRPAVPLQVEPRYRPIPNYRYDLHFWFLLVNPP